MNKQVRDNEQYYDEVIAPLLQEIIDKCSENEMPFLAATQYNNEEWADAKNIYEEMPLTMHIIKICMQTVPNIDAFIIGVIKHCRKNNIPMDQSIMLRYFLTEEEKGNT